MLLLRSETNALSAMESTRAGASARLKTVCISDPHLYLLYLCASQAALEEVSTILRRTSSVDKWRVETARLVLSEGREDKMLFTIAVILLVLWLLGLVSGYTLGNFIYVLLVIAIVLFVVGLLSGRRTV
jgi:hypothetical protein